LSIGIQVRRLPINFVYVLARNRKLKLGEFLTVIGYGGKKGD